MQIIVYFCASCRSHACEGSRIIITTSESVGAYQFTWPEVAASTLAAPLMCFIELIQPQFWAAGEGAMTERKKMQGVTLLELLVVLVIGAILTSIAAPSFQNTIKRNRVQSHVHDLSAVLSIARSEAVTRVETVSVCGSTDQASCNDSADWSAGWIVFVDNGAGDGTAADGKYNGREEIIKTYRYQGTNTLSVKSSTDEPLKALSFGARGSVTQNTVATLRICDKDGDANYARALLLERTGRVVYAHDLYDSSGNRAADGMYEDAVGNNLTCT